MLDNPLHYLHRLSRVEFAFGHLREAQVAAKKAVESTTRPPFEVLAHLIYCEIELGDMKEAENLLKELDRRFGNIKHDVRLGLRCRLEIEKGRFGEALAQTERIHDKESIFYKKIRRDALSGELKYSALTDATRVAYEVEVAKLNDELDSIPTTFSAPFELD